MAELQMSMHDIVLLRVTQADGGTSPGGDEVRLALQMQVNGQLSGTRCVEAQHDGSQVRH